MTAKILMSKPGEVSHSNQADQVTWHERSAHVGWFHQNRLSRTGIVRPFLVALLSLAAFALAFTVDAKGSSEWPQGYTIHIGLRIPPSDAGCLVVGGMNNDVGKHLNVYACPPTLFDGSRHQSFHRPVISDGSSSSSH